ncbi:MAG TPA: hypothetical protein VGD63_09345 [Steroidobacteraceae bacterium]
MSATIDASRLAMLLNELRLPATKHLWQQFAERSDKKGRPAARLLMALMVTLQLFIPSQGYNSQPAFN